MTIKQGSILDDENN